MATNGVLNKLIVNSGLTSTNGTAGTFTANGYQYFGNGASGVGNIIPFAEVNGNTSTSGPGDFASYSANGVTAFANYISQSFSAAGTLTVSTASDIIKVSATGVPPTPSRLPPTPPSALLLVNSSLTAVVLNMNSNGTLTIASGAILLGGSNTSNTTFAGGTFTLPGPSGSFTGEINFFENANGSSTRIDGNLIGTGSLVVAGAGPFNFDMQQTGRSYSGGTTINNGSNVFIQTATASMGTGPVTLTGGTLSPNLAFGLINPVNLNGYLSISNNTAGASIVFDGKVTLTNNTFLNTANGSGPGTVTFPNTIAEAVVPTL